MKKKKEKKPFMSVADQLAAYEAMKEILPPPPKTSVSVMTGIIKPQK